MSPTSDELLADLKDAAWDVVHRVITITHNRDGDELEGCEICDPDKPFTHRDDCPMPAFVAALIA